MQKAHLAAVLALCGCLLPCRAAKATKYEITSDVQSALDRISPAALRGDLSFLSSDLLEGRGTPSRGLEIAADFIASQFRRAGLEPAVNGDYFQVADMIVKRPDMSGFRLEFTAVKERVTIAPEEARADVNAAIDLKAADLFKFVAADAPKAEDLDGKVVLVQFRDARAARPILRKAHPALVIAMGRSAPQVGEPETTLIDPSEKAAAATPRIIVYSSKMAALYEALKPGLNAGAVSVHVAAPSQEHTKLRNVIGVLAGSDPALKDTYVLVTAHYDHLGMKTAGEGDRIYNGANDDGSGTVSMIEIANALAGMKKHPGRTIVFIAFFGEEEGLIGSEYYVHHPVFSLSKTVADVNLEQLGRTDSSKGKQLSNAAPTGYAYSNMIDVFRAAGDQTGVKIYDDSDSDLYFAASDNLAFAEAGIPAHTFCVAFKYPDYHAVGDEWQKIDYDNMAKVDRMLALGIEMLGDDANPPRWNPDNPKAKRYADASKQ